MNASTYWFWWKISKIYHAIATTIGSSKARHRRLMTHLCPLRGQSVWDRTVCGFCFFLAGMEPQDMISWRNKTNNLPGFINNYILQRDNVRIDETPLNWEETDHQRWHTNVIVTFCFNVILLYFLSITALSEGNAPMNSWTTKQTLWICWYANVGQICQ